MTLESITKEMEQWDAEKAKRGDEFNVKEWEMYRHVRRRYLSYQHIQKKRINFRKIRAYSDEGVI